MITLTKHALAIGLLTLPVVLFGQGNTSLAYDAYLSGSTTIWENAFKKSQDQYRKSGKKKDLLVLSVTGYGLLNATMKDQNEDIFDAYVDQVEEHLESLEESNEYKAEALALHSGVYGFKIAYSPWKGMFLGPKSTSYLDRALELDPSSAIVQKLYAGNQYFTPEMWGGDKDKALLAFMKSNDLFLKADQSSHWMFLDNLAWIGLIHKERENDDEAREVWLQALSYEPNFFWVREGLLPSVK